MTDGPARHVLTAGLLLAACSGGQTGDEGVVLAGGQCKKFEDDQSAGGATASALSSTHAGLQCVAWNVDDGVLRLELSNVEGPCLVEVDWEGRAKGRDGALDLVASAEPECRIAACGACTYDFAFERPLTATTEPLELRFSLEICEKLEEPSIQVKLPLDQTDHGLVCRQLSASTLSWLGMSGAAHLPCGSGGDAGLGSCDEGLVCDHADDELCLTPCTADDDCPLRGLETCDDGLCRAAAAL